MPTRMKNLLGFMTCPESGEACDLAFFAPGDRHLFNKYDCTKDVKLGWLRFAGRACVAGWTRYGRLFGYYLVRISFSCLVTRR